jgi:hypothetical protein
MENNDFTAQESVMIELGLNPGMIENYAEVSLIPESFEQEDRFSWGSTWSGVHEARGPSGGKVLVNGFSFNVTKSKPTFKDLLNAWRKEQQRRDDEAYWKEQDGR